MEMHINMKFDKWLLLAVLVLLALGVFVIYTGSSHAAMEKGFSPAYYTIVHIKKIAMGLCALCFGFFVDHRFWLKVARLGFILCLGLLIAVLFQSVEVKGAARWLDLGFLKLQPSEAMKLAIFALLSVKLADAGDQMQSFKVGFLRPMILVGMVALVLLLQPNFSMVLMVVGTAFVMLFVAGTRLTHLVIPLLACIPAAFFVAFFEEYRVKRIMAFLHPEQYAKGDAYQLIQSLISLGNGGLFGTGIGQGTQKLGFVPESYKDAAFTILGEELGFLGTLCVLILFAVVAYRGFTIARNARSRFAKYFAVALTTSICLNAIFHICVCTGLMPTTGQPLPFISFGGTSLVVALLSVGILLNISRPTSGALIHEDPIGPNGYSVRYT
jgi:cell division protein FtsW